MLRDLSVSALIFFITVVASATTTTINFDSPTCPNLNGSLTGIFGGINWGSSPWGCEIAGAPTDTTISVSWNRQVTQATFSFTAPSVLVSLNAGTSSGSGALTISTDAGETTARTLSSGAAALIATNFVKPATVVTVKYTNGWYLELDNITYSTTPAVSIAIAPTSASIAVNTTQQFTATVQNCGTNCGVNWSMTAGTGSINQSGLFTAPNAVETDTVTVQAQADLTKKATATINVTNSAPPVSISISPTGVTLPTTGTQQFTASVQNCGSNCGVYWSVTQGTGTITQSGLFTAPSTSESDTVQVQAQADMSKTASAVVTVNQVLAPAITATSIQIQLQANEPVTWLVTSGAGSITSTGLFAEPYGTPPEMTTVVATSTADPTKSTSFTITVQPK